MPIMNDGLCFSNSLFYLPFWQSGLIISPRMINILFADYARKSKSVIVLYKWCFLLSGIFTLNLYITKLMENETFVIDYKLKDYLQIPENQNNMPQLKCTVSNIAKWSGYSCPTDLFLLVGVTFCDSIFTVYSDVPFTKFSAYFNLYMKSFSEKIW